MQAQKAGGKTIKVINDFVAQFKTTLPLDESCIVRKRNRFYLLSKKLKQQAPKGFFYAGTYLGAIKGTSFFPSFLLLAMIAKTKANKLIVDKKTAWLFICGRDIFKKGILKANSLKKGDFTLVLNEHNECLGFGKMITNLRAEIDLNKAAVKNILDIGDFLRRERQHLQKQQRSIKPSKHSRK
jgi:ribosome biogenesis protein Nip4